MENERFPNWVTLYEEMPVEEMGWYIPELDPDLAKALQAMGQNSGRFLDLGAGPCTQSEALARMGFEVTATDISGEAMRLAREKYDNIEALEDDILDTKLEGEFDYVFDRGVFHIFTDDRQPDYLRSLTKLLVKGGIFFLKVFSDKNEDRGQGPYLYSKEMLEGVFGEDFEVESIVDTQFQGVGEHRPKALFAVLRRK